ncbi:MAG: DUF4247 domain-containing protein [Pseudonocardiaceae bacterium]
MTLPVKLIVAGLVAVIGLAAIGVAVSRTGGVRSYLADNYTRVSSQGDSVVYTSARRPATVYEEIRSRHRPADTLVRPRGYYLRYSDDIVVVTADARGSRIYVDDEDRGYARWFPIVGGVWGTYRGSGDAFRGGGPGSGK